MPKPSWFTMDEKLECAECGTVGDRYTIAEGIRWNGDPLGEWYCVEGEGCQTKKEVKHETN